MSFSPQPLPAPDSQASGLEITPLWDKPLVPVFGGEATLLVRIAAAGVATARRAPIDVAFVLDRSGSMAGDKLALVKEAVTVAAGHLRDADRAALVVYDHAVDTLHPLQPATPRAKTALRLALHGVDAGGSTNLGDGWLSGCRELTEAVDGADEASGAQATRIRRALLLTDGLANVGITDAGELTTHAHELRKRGIGTTTLGVGLDFDEDLLGGVAEAGGGNFQFIAAADQLRAFFERELQELLTIAAAGLTLTLTLPEGIEADLVNPVPCERREDRLVVEVGDLPAGDTLDLVFAVRIAPGTAGTSRRLGLGVRWSDPAADAQRSAEPAAAPLVFADAATVEVTVADPLVAEQAALQRAAVARRVALRLDREGRHAESRRRMHEAVALLAAAPMSDAVRDDLAMTEHYAVFEASAPYAEFDRKQGAFLNARRARGKGRPDDR